MIDKQADALKRLGKVHAYTTFLVREGLLPLEALTTFCNTFYEHHKEIRIPLREALAKAIEGRKESFERDKALLKSTGDKHGR